MTKQELAALPKGTKLFLISRKISRSGMRQVFDVFHVTVYADRSVRPSWVRLSDVEARQFSRLCDAHASGDIDADRRNGGAFYVNGCGFSRSGELVKELGRWATGDDTHFTCEVL